MFSWKKILLTLTVFMLGVSLSACSDNTNRDTNRDTNAHTIDGVENVHTDTNHVEVDLSPTKIHEEDLEELDELQRNWREHAKEGSRKLKSRRGSQIEITGDPRTGWAYEKHYENGSWYSLSICHGRQLVTVTNLYSSQDPQTYGSQYCKGVNEISTAAMDAKKGWRRVAGAVSICLPGGVYDNRSERENSFDEIASERTLVALMLQNDRVEPGIYAESAVVDDVDYCE